MTVYYKTENGSKIEMSAAEVAQLEIDMGNRIGHLCVSMRSMRDQLIASTDWWATSDRTMSAEQTAYRQALRDITAQAGWPTDITWPTKPE